MTRALPWLIVALAAGFGAALAVALLDLPPHAVHLPHAVANHLAASGVAHPITAVLLNFRGYDTLLEIAVLLLALLGVPTLPTLPARAARRPPRLESRLRAWPFAGALWLALLASLILLLGR